MPDPNPSTTPSPTSTNWLSDAPGADIPFSELFGNDPEVTATTTPTTAAPAAASEPQAPTEPAKTEPVSQSFRITTKTGTVYDSLEAATSGIEEKDTVIEQLRQRFIATTGVDPLKKTPQSAPTVETPNYLQDPNRYAADLYEAAKKNDAKGYQRTQLQLFEQYLGPALPMFQEFVKERAQDGVSAKSLPPEAKNFREFRSSEAFKRVMTENEVLAQAITNAESNFQYASQLPGLYKLAYNSYVASNLPEVIQAAPAVAAPSAPPISRPTASTSTLSPTAPQSSQNDQELLRTREGRAELKRRYEASGLANQNWDAISWGRQ